MHMYMSYMSLTDMTYMWKCSVHICFWFDIVHHLINGLEGRKIKRLSIDNCLSNFYVCPMQMIVKMLLSLPVPQHQQHRVIARICIMEQFPAAVERKGLPVNNHSSDLGV